MKNRSKPQLDDQTNKEQIVLSAKDLTRRFGDFTAVDHINFEVKRGEIFGFLGPNGSGKTTTIRMMLGLLKPTQGSIEVLGLKVDGDTRDIRHKLGYMSQRFSLYNDLTVLQNLKFHSAAYGIEPSRQKDVKSIRRDAFPHSCTPFSNSIIIWSRFQDLLFLAFFEFSAVNDD